MNSETLREWLSRRPFEPFILRLSNAEAFEVRHPENAIVLKTKIIVGYPETERVVHVALIHVNSIESLQSA